jgi:hypothetical protein
VSFYGAGPATPGTVVLKRDAYGATDWIPPFCVGLSGSGRIRWWCHSTTGNMFDPGTWRIEELQGATTCEIFVNGSAKSCRPDTSIKLGSAAWNGWTAERSRCGNQSTKIRARLGPDRLLQIDWLVNI